MFNVAIPIICYVIILLLWLGVAELYFHFIACKTASVVLWSEFLATDPEAWVRFPVLPKEK
jgi:hypothetical protein